MTALGVEAPTAADEQLAWRRLNPRMLLVHPIMQTLRAAPALLALLVVDSGGGHGALWSVAGVAVVVASATLRWFTTSYRVGATQIELRRGLLRRQTTTVPRDRVRTVDVTSHALHRVLGLAKVAIGTGLSDHRDHNGLDLDGLSRAAAARLRDELLHRDRAASTGSVGVGPGPGEPSMPDREIARLELSWIRFAPFTMTGALTALSLFGFAWRLAADANLNLRKTAVLNAVGRQAVRTPIWVDVIEAAAVIALFVALTSIAGYLLAFWDFRLSRAADGSVHVSRGLLTTRTTSLDARRLNGVEISEPLVLRAVGGGRCLAIATGLRVGRGAERGGTVLLPPAPRRIAEQVGTEILGDPAPLRVPLSAHGPRARRRRYVRACLGAIALIGVAGVVLWSAGAAFEPLLLLAALLPASWLLAADRYRSLGSAVTAGYLCTRFGSLSRRRIGLACDDIIGWNVRRSMFQRRAGLVTLTATTAAGRQRYHVFDIEAAAAYRLAAAATPGLLEQFIGDAVEAGRA